MSGAPEALRPIARYKIGYHTDEWGMRSSTPSGIPDHAGTWVRYEDHVAALQAQQPAPSVAVALSDDLRDRLVAISEAIADQDDRAAQAMLREILAAQQPATHVQNPAGIEHVAGDVSKNGPESNMAQQPAPSAAAVVNPDPHAELRKTWQPGQRWQARSFRNGQWGPWTDAVASEPFWFPHQDYRRHPDDLAPQPSPTPQADSQPASIDMVLHCPACGLQHIDASEPPVEFEPGAAQWNNPPHRSHLCHGCGHIWRPADVPTNGVAAVKTTGKADSPIAARTPADSVTAPAGGGVVGWLPVHFNGHGFYGGPLKTEAEANQYIAQVHQSSDSVTLTARPFAWVDTTPPAQAADSVPEAAALSQAARDVLAERKRQINAEGWTPEHDDEQHLPGELALAAASYVCADENDAPPAIWPWALNWWKPRDRRRNLTKAGALILAEMERIDRAARKQGGAT